MGINVSRAYLRRSDVTLNWLLSNRFDTCWMRSLKLWSLGGGFNGLLTKNDNNNDINNKGDNDHNIDDNNEKKTSGEWDVEIVPS